MSRRAILIAVRDHLRAGAADGGLALRPEECDLAPIQGKPPAIAGKTFVGIWSGGRSRTQRVSAGLDATYAVNVTVSLRVNEPFDRLGTGLTELPDVGLDDLIDLIITCIHQDSYDHRVIRRANAVIDSAFTAAAGPWAFVEGMEYLSDGEASPVGPEWFSADPEGEGLEIAGVTCTVRFGGARRVASYVDG